MPAKKPSCLLNVALVACTCGLLPGCAAVKATRQPPKLDMGVLEPGMPRTHVIAELGAPVWSQRKEGGEVDLIVPAGRVDGRWLAASRQRRQYA